jgi:hypothetical protein
MATTVHDVAGLIGVRSGCDAERFYAPGDEYGMSGRVAAVGSSSSKPRKGHKKPRHLPKVGSPANQQWEHETHRSVQFGSSATALVISAVLILAVVGLLVLIL